MDIQRQPNFHCVAWVLVADFNQIYGENWRQNTEQENLKNLNSHKEGTCVMLEPKILFIAAENSAI